MLVGSTYPSFRDGLEMYLFRAPFGNSLSFVAHKKDGAGSVFSRDYVKSEEFMYGPNCRELNGLS